MTSENRRHSRLAATLSNALASPQAEVHIERLAGSLFVRVSGNLRGSSVAFAASRRARLKRAIQAAGRRTGGAVHLRYEAQDAITRFEQFVADKLRASTPHSIDIAISWAQQCVPIISVTFAKPPIESRVVLERAFLDSIRSVAKAFGVGLLRGSITFDGLEPPPASDPRILLVLRVHSPASLPSIERHLRDVGAIVPSLQWLRHRLDALRQRGHVQYLGKDRYRLSGQGLAAVPGRIAANSPDVSRALTLARRRW